jgi:hypothetical protein
MNYRKFTIDEETLRIYSPEGNRVAAHVPFNTVNYCIEYIDFLLRPFRKLNYNNIELVKIIEDENGGEKEREFKDWMDNESENSLHNSTSHHYE